MESITLDSNSVLRSKTDCLMTAKMARFPPGLIICTIFRKFMKKSLVVKKKSVPLQSDSKNLILRYGFGPRIDSLAQ